MSKKQKRSNSQGSRRSTQAPTTVAGQTSPAETPAQSPARSSYSPSARTPGATRTSGSMSTVGSRRFMPAPEFKPKTDRNFSWLVFGFFDYPFFLPKMTIVSPFS